MQDQELEQHFSYIGEELVNLREDVSLLKDDVSNLKDDVSNLKDDVSNLKDDVRGLKSSFSRQEDLLKLVFDIVKVYDVERKEIKASLWEHDRRLQNLERA